VLSGLEAVVERMHNCVLAGTECYDLLGLEDGVTPRQDVVLVISRGNGEVKHVPVTTPHRHPIEVDYYLHGGILPYVLRQLLAA
jgi:aconitate hydratase